MAFEKSYNESLPIVGEPCIHLRSKGMIVTGQLKSPNHPDEAGAEYCWCNLTQHILGPDTKDVERRECSASGRDCYKETH